MKWAEIEIEAERLAKTLEPDELRRMLHDARRCLAVRKDGLLCRNFAAWVSDGQLCQRHRPDKRTSSSARKKSSRPKCQCRAYAFPHKPTTGNCRWPEPPLIVSDKPAGTRRQKPVLSINENGRAAQVAVNVSKKSISPFDDCFWRGKHIRAVYLLIDGQLTNEAIAHQLRISDRQLYRWKANPVFAKGFALAEKQMVDALCL